MWRLCQGCRCQGRRSCSEAWAWLGQAQEGLVLWEGFCGGFRVCHACLLVCRSWAPLGTLGRSARTTGGPISSPYEPSTSAAVPAALASTQHQHQQPWKPFHCLVCPLYLWVEGLGSNGLWLLPPCMLLSTVLQQCLYHLWQPQTPPVASPDMAWLWELLPEGQDAWVLQWWLGQLFSLIGGARGGLGGYLWCPRPSWNGSW